MIIVSDDFPGIANAIEKFFLDTDHQFCFIHLQRNVTARMSKQDA
jgi:MULE transposase domain.